MFRKLSRAACALFLICTPLFSASIIDFDNLPLAENSHDAGDAASLPFSVQGVSFNRIWNSFCDNGCPNGWAYSNETDLTTAGFSNPYTAFARPNGGGFDGSANFAVANNLVRGEAIIRFPAPASVQGMYVTNTTYTYLSVAQGNDGAGFVKGPFGPGDWLKLTVYGIDASGQETGNVDFLLADFIDQNTGVVDNWTWLDLNELGNNVSSLEFEMASTDSGQFGMNTPAYFAIDNLTLEFVPEPSSQTFLALVVLSLCIRLGRSRPI